VWKECRPDSLEYDAITDELVVAFNNLNGIPATSVKVCLLKFGSSADTFVVSGGQIGVGFTDTLPEMCVYGIDAAEVGPDFAPNRLTDAYRDQAAETPVTVQLFTPFMESSLAADQSTVALSVLVDTELAPTVQLGPVFSTERWRSRGNIVTPDAGPSGLISDPHVTVVSDVNAEVFIPLTVFQEDGDIPLCVNDKLTLQRMFRPELDGTHAILSFTIEATGIRFTIPNPAPLLGNLITGHGGQAGIFTNYFKTFAGVVCPFLIGDILTASSNITDFGVFSGFYNDELALELSKNVSLPYNQTVIARRVATVIPLTKSFLVNGDSVVVSGGYRQVLGAQVGSDLTVTSVSGDGTEAQAIIAGEYYHTFNRNRKFLLLQAGEFTGEQVCSNVMWDGTSTTVFFAHTSTSTFVGGHIAGNSIEVAPIEVEAEVVVALPARWEALEGLRDETLGNRGPDDCPKCLTADETLISSGFGGVLYAGSQNNYPIALDPFGWRNTGMPDWDPIVNIKVSGVLGPYVAPNVVDYSSVTGITFRILKEDEPSMQIGDLYQVADGFSYLNKTGTVQVMSKVVEADPSTYAYITAAPITGTIGTNPPGQLSRVTTYRYYAQLRYVDFAGNIVVGPAGGLADIFVDLSDSVAPLLTLIEPPHVGYIDYSRGVFIDIYRTKAIYGTSTQAEINSYYKVTSLACTFSGSPYITFLDTLSDELLGEQDVVSITIADSLGAKTSKALFTAPPRCKTLTSAGGYMVYGNLTGRPRCSVSFLSDQTLTASSLATGTFTIGGQVFRFSNSNVNITAASWAGGVASLTLSSVTGLSEGSWIYVSPLAPTSAAPGYIASGWAKVLTIVGSVVTVSLPGATGTLPTDFVSGYYGQVNLPGAVGAIPVPLQQYEPIDFRLPVSARAMRNLAKAISVVSSINNDTRFFARAGSAIGQGTINIWSTIADQTVVISLPSATRLSINDEYKVQTATGQFEEQLFPSRLALSGKGYAEVCGAYDYDAGRAGTSIIDVNPADGDEIIAIRPLLADALFSDTQLQQVLIVFKRRSVHAVDIIKRVNGSGDYSQQIVSYGVGCCSPLAVAHTEHGIVFAGRDSIYLLDQGLKLSRIGELVERQLDERNYPADETISSRGGEKAYISWGSDTFVAKPYPQSEQWSRWELPRKVFGWTSVDSRAVAGCQGRMVEFRLDLGKDDSVAFTSQVTLKAQDFGDPSILKDLNEIVVDANVRNIQVEFATELRTNWMPCTLVKPKPEFADDALTETYRSRRSTLRFACPAKKFQALQIRVTLVGDVSEVVATLDSSAESDVLVAAKEMLQGWIARYGAGNIVPTEEQIARDSQLRLSRVVYKVRGGTTRGTVEALD
jgi:hypothetical protein